MAKDIFGIGALDKSIPLQQAMGTLGAAQTAGVNQDWATQMLARAARGDYSWLAEATPEQLQAYQTAASQQYTRDQHGGMKDPSALQPPPSLQQLQQGQVSAQRDARYGSDLSWLDPSFQYDPAVLGQSAGSQAAADPATVARQNEAMDIAKQYSTANLQFGSDAQQQAALSGLMGIKAPQFAGGADQRAVLNAALGMSSNTGPGSLSFDNGARQGEQYQNLKDIIGGGGATAIEMANRQKQRADSESWLRGQREADMADYAERGLTGSGMELLNLSADRQAAAGRNSLSDLETAKALEERRLGAINSASGLATNMRGQTIDEQGLLNNRATSGLNAAGSVANAMRSSDIQEQLGLNTALQNQYTNAGNLAGNMRTQTANEQVANRNAQQAALGTLANTATTARNQSAQESQYRAGAADDFATLNQSAINNSRSSNTQFLQNAYTNMMQQRQQWEQTQLLQQLAQSQGLMNFDQNENQSAYRAGANLGGTVANQYNDASGQLRSATLGAAGVANQNDLTGAQNANQIIPQIGQWGGDVVGTVASSGINAASGAGGGGSGGAPVAGAPLSTQGTTWAQSPSFLPANYNLDSFR